MNFQVITDGPNNGWVSLWFWGFTTWYEIHMHSVEILLWILSFSWTRGTGWDSVMLGRGKEPQFHKPCDHESEQPVCSLSHSVSLSVQYPMNYMKYLTLWASQVALMVKNLSARAGNIRDEDLIPGLGRSPGEGCGKFTITLL